MAFERGERGRFLPGSGGRQTGSRNKLQGDFIDALARSFNEGGGAAAIKIVLAERPADYLKIIASVLPKEWLIPDTGPLAELSDDEVAGIIAFARARKTAA